MEVSHFTDALSVAFFALLGLWAAAVRGHWFLRGATVSAVLMTTLLLPAYELVVEFGLEMLVIALVVSMVRGQKPWQSRWSLETALLLTVALAVVFAIAGKLPDFTLAQWLGMFGVGLVTPLFALLSLWIVYGQASLARRMIGGTLAVILLLLVVQFGDAVRYALNSNSPWQTSFSQFYDPAYIPTWLLWNLKTTAIGLTAMIVTLSLARASGWFNAADSASLHDGAPHDAQPAPASLRIHLARVGLVTTFAAIGLPLLYVLYRLLTPPSLPALNLPSPNGYDDIIAAGIAAPQELGDLDLATIRSWSFAKLEQHLELAMPVTAEIEAALEKPCRVVDPYTNWSDPARAREAAALHKAYKALAVRVYFSKHFATPQEFVEAALLELRYGHAVNRGAADLDVHSVQTFDSGAVWRLQDVIGRLSANDCRSAAATLFEVDAAREPLSRVAERQRIAEKHLGWDWHLRALLQEWAGREISDRRGLLRDEDYFIANLRLLAVDLALQAFALEHKRLPGELEELAPEYLPAVPLDRLSGGPFVYRRFGDRYVLYSVGWDRDDDGGRIGFRIDEGDIVTTGPHGPPRWMAFRDAAADQLNLFWQKFWDPQSQRPADSPVTGPR